MFDNDTPAEDVYAALMAMIADEEAAGAAQAVEDEDPGQSQPEKGMVQSSA